MKKKSIKLLIVSLVLTIGTTLAVGCSSKSSDTSTKETTKTEAKKAEELEVFKTSDNLHEISVAKSENWTDLNANLPGVVLSKQSASTNRALAISSEAKSKFASTMTLKDYSNLSVQAMKQTAKGGTPTEFKDVTINGIKGIQFEFSGEVNQVKATYLVTVIDDGKSFNKVSIFTTSDEFNKSKSDFEKITNSFK